MKKNCGFTLIELIVTISIISILAGIGYAKYNEFNRRQILTQATQELKSNLRLAQDKAMAGEKDCSVCQVGPICGDSDDRQLEGWYVSFPSVNNYEVYGSCGSLQFSLQNIDLSNSKVTIATPLPQPILFKPLGQKVERETTITFSGFGFTQQVIVTATGEIK